MDSSSGSGASTLLRPRVLSAVIITATVAISLSAGIWYESWRQGRADDAELASGGGLHRRNAVRRTRHSSSTDGPNASAVDDQAAAATSNANANANASATTANAPTTDETLNNVQPLQSGGSGEDRDVTVVDDAEMDENERWMDDGNMPGSTQRAGHNIVNLLFRVSEDNARRGAYVHRGCACNACGIVPIRGIRYRCANCADFDLCETCESQGLHYKTHIFYKVKVPAPPFGPRQMQPVWYTGDPDGFPRGLPKSLISRLSRETGFERQELEAFWEQWTFMANTEWREDPDGLGLAMDRKTFERCLVPSGGYRHAAPNLIHDRMFAFYDTNNDGLIGFSEFLHGLTYRKRKDKLRKIFDGYDTDRDGLVSRRDFLRFFRAYYVLYKQMHKDILEGLDDQVMSSIETHQLVGNRQPVSSFFGRDGRLPPADTERMMGGKYIDHGPGEVRVADNVDGVVAPNQPDTVDREELLAMLYTRSRMDYNNDRGRFEERYYAVGQDGNEEHDDGPGIINYWNALLNPPRTVGELPGLILGQRDSSSGLNDDMFVSNQDNEYEQGDDSAAMGLGAAELRAALARTGGSDDNASTTAIYDVPLPSVERDTDTDGDVVAAVIANATENENENESANAAGTPTTGSPSEAMTASAPATTVASTPAPDGTNPAHPRGHGEGISPLDSSTTEQRDFITSNPQITTNTYHTPTSGQRAARKEAYQHAHVIKTAKVAARRRLYDRWRRRRFYLDEEEGANPPTGWTEDEDLLKGGPADEKAESSTADLGDIPESERDAGREVLYQVMQQSFNELLDVLFLRKEDLAIAAAESRKKRDKYRKVFQALRVAADPGGGIGVGYRVTTSSNKKASASTAAAATASSSVDKEVSDMTLEEMLAETGYEVIGGVPTESLGAPHSRANGNAVRTAAPAPEANEAEISVVEEILEEKVEVVDAETKAKEQAAAEAHDKSAEDTAEAAEVPDSPAADPQIVPDDVPEISLTAAASVDGNDNEKDSEYRDPTLPHFRPNTEAEYAALVAQQASIQAPSRAASLVAASTAATVATSSEGRSSPGTTTPPVEESSAEKTVTTVEDAEDEPSTDANQDKAKGKGKGKEEDAPQGANVEADSPSAAKEASPNGTAVHGEASKAEKTEQTNDGAQDGKGTPDPSIEALPLSELLNMKRLDLAEEEAKARGGWGKLTYEEFEYIFKQEERHSIQRLDYLGSWIDFCIP